MNTEQKDRLLKLAEDNPNLAKDVVDILKADTEKSAASDAPVAVKIIKDEDDKLVITEEQKKWAIGYLFSVAMACLSVIVSGVTLTKYTASFDMADKIFPLFFIWFILSIFFSCKAGMPTIREANFLKSTTI